MKLAPAILVSDRVALEEQLALARQMTDRVQIDIIDGIYAKNKTVTLTELQPQTDLVVDLDLMVSKPSEQVQAAINLQPARIIFHVEVEEELVRGLEQVRAASIGAGLALNPDRTVADIRGCIPQITSVVIMGYPAGFAGQTFQPAVLEKVTQIKALRSDIEICLDGGVNQTTIEQIASAGVDVAYVNSAVFEHPNPVAQFKKLQELAQ